MSGNEKERSFVLRENYFQETPLQLNQAAFHKKKKKYIYKLYFNISQKYEGYRKKNCNKMT